MSDSKRRQLARRIASQTGDAVFIVDAVLDELRNVIMDDLMNEGTFTLPEVMTLSVREMPTHEFTGIDGEIHRADENKKFRVDATVASSIKEDVNK